jgi:hypothetical protein
MKPQWIKFVADLRTAFYNDDLLINLVAAQDELVQHNEYGNEWIKAATNAIRVQMHATPQQLGVTVFERETMTINDDPERKTHSAAWSQITHSIIFPTDVSFWQTLELDELEELEDKQFIMSHPNHDDDLAAAIQMMIDKRNAENTRRSLECKAFGIATRNDAPRIDHYDLPIGFKEQQTTPPYDAVVAQLKRVLSTTMHHHAALQSHVDNRDMCVEARSSESLQYLFIEDCPSCHRECHIHLKCGKPICMPPHTDVFGVRELAGVASSRPFRRWFKNSCESYVHDPNDHMDIFAEHETIVTKYDGVMAQLRAKQSEPVDEQARAQRLEILHTIDDADRTNRDLAHIFDIVNRIEIENPNPRDEIQPEIDEAMSHCSARIRLVHESLKTAADAPEFYQRTR